MYQRMRGAPQNSKMAPTVHAYTAAMRAATEGGKWQKALEIWQDMGSAGVEPSGVLLWLSAVHQRRKSYCRASQLWSF